MEAKSRWVARPWARCRRSGWVVSARLSATCARRRDPYRPVEGAGHVGGEDVGDREGCLRPADLGELDPRELAGPKRSRPLGLLERRHALVCGEGDRRATWPASPSPPVPPPAAPRARSPAAPVPPACASRSPGPKPRSRPPESAPPARLPLAPRAPARRQDREMRKKAPARCLFAHLGAELQLERGESILRPPERLRRHLLWSPGDERRIARNRFGRTRPSRRPRRPPTPQIHQRRLHRTPRRS